MAKGIGEKTLHKCASRALLTIAMVALLIGAFYTIQLCSDDSSGESTSIVLDELVEFNDYPGIYEIHWEGSINGSTIIQSDVYASLVGVRVPTGSSEPVKMEFLEAIHVESIKHEGVEIFSGDVPVTKWDIGKNESNFLFEGYDKDSDIQMEFVMPNTISYVNPDVILGIDSGGGAEFIHVKSISFDKDNPNYMFDNEDGILYRIINEDSRELIAFFPGMSYDMKSELEPLTINLQDSVKIIRDNAFFWIQLYGWGESEINIPSNSKLEKIGTGSLSYATIKFEGTFPSTLKYIESSAFVGSTIRGITSADFLPSGLIELGRSEDSPFSECNFITNTDYSFDTITIPSSLEFIAESCFDDFSISNKNNWECTFIIKHRNIYAPGYVPLTIEKDAFGVAYDYEGNYVYPHNIIFENDDLYSFNIARNLADQTEYAANELIGYILKLNETATFDLVWNFKEVNVTLDPYGGKFDDGTTDPKTIQMNYSCPFGDLPELKRVGCIFEGWYTAEIGGKEVSAKNIVETDEGFTLYARWSSNHHTVKFIADGADHVPEPAIIEYSKPFVNILPTVEKKYHTFSHWSLDIEGNERVYADTCATLADDEYDVDYVFILYANFEPILYTITFDTVGGTPVDLISQPYGMNVEKPKDPTKVGYRFAGWDRNIPATMPAENITITAKWNINQYTITFDTISGSDIANITQDFGSAITKPIDPTRVGYTFTGWDREIPATMPAENIIITAKWDANQYTITFRIDEKTTMAVIEQDCDSVITKPIDPTKVGYTFAGWDKDVPANMPAENVTITAKWTINTYKVTWVNENGDVLAEDVVKYNVKPAYSGDEPVKTPTAQYSYAFNGWSPEIVAATEDTTYIATFTPTINRYTVTWVNHDGTVLETDRSVEYGTTPIYDGATPTKVANVQYTFSFKGWDNPPSTVKGDTTYRAVFNSFVKEYTITFDTKGGSAVEPITLSYGTRVQAPADPTRTGHTFLGWTPGIPDEMTEDITCVALWAPFTYTVVFDNNGGTGSMDNIALEYAKDGRIPQCTFTRTEHRFLAWNTAADGSGTTYQDGSTIRHLGLENGETITLYAIWKINQYPVHFTVDGVDIPGYPIMSDYGSSIIAPDAPTKDSTEEYDFKFIEWVGYVASIKVTGEMYFNAAFSASPIVEPEVADGKVVFDVNELEGITLSTKIIQDIEASFQNNEGLKIVFELNGGIIELDKKAFDMLEGNELISIINVPTSNMPGTILNKVQDRPVFDISMGDVHNFGGGKLLISLHYDLKENEDADNIRIWHFDNEGNHTVTRCTYDLDSETVTFMVNSLSYFSIMYEEDEEPETSSFGSTIYVILSIVMIMALFGAIMMYSKKS